MQLRTLAVATLIATLPIQGYAQADAEPSKQMKEFLAFDRTNQEAFVANGIVMIGVIASQVKPKIARCIDDWYLKNSKSKEMRRDEILKTMRKFPNYLPQAILLAVVEKACGKFQRAK